MATAQQPLSDTEIRELLVGKTLSLKSGATIEHAANGRYTYNKSVTTSVGKYTIAGGSVCVDFDSGRKRCDRIMKDAQGPYVLSSSNFVDHFLLQTSGAAAGQTSTLQACEPTISYRLQMPGKEVPERMRALSGVWVGYWANQICGALIVEAIGNDGSVTAKSVNGRNPNFVVTQPGIRSMAGRVVKGTLTLQSADETIEYRVANSSELAGVYRRLARSSVGQFFNRRLPPGPQVLLLVRSNAVLQAARLTELARAGIGSVCHAVLPIPIGTGILVPTVTFAGSLARFALRSGVHLGRLRGSRRGDDERQKDAQSSILVHVTPPR